MIVPAPLLPGLPRDVADAGPRIDWLLHFGLTAIAALFAVLCAWLLYTCVAHGRRHRAVPLRGESRRARWGVFGVALFVFLLVDGTLFGRTLGELRDVFWSFAHDRAPPWSLAHPDGSLRVEINAQRWSWSIRYAGPDGTFGTADDAVTLDDLRVPIGVPVIVELAASDVIHSFFLPNLRVKEDAVPGQIHRFWFQADRPGTFDLACAQFCGAGHYEMRGTLTVMPAAAFAAWLAHQGTVTRGVVSGAPASATYARWGWPWKDGV